MPEFPCQNCGADLSVNIDLLAHSLKTDHPDGNLPKQVGLDGYCSECDGPFSFNGSMFTHYMNTRVREEMFSPEIEDYAIFEVEVTEEQALLFQKLLDEGRHEELEKLVESWVRDKNPDLPDNIL